MSPTLNGPCHNLQWTSEFARKLAKSSLGGEVFAFSEMLEHVSHLRQFYEPFFELSPSMIGFKDRESPFANLNIKETVAEKYAVRHFQGIRQLLGDAE